MSSAHSLSKQKHRLAVLFSLSIFAIIVVLDIAFISFKYFDYQRQEFSRLSFQAQSIIKAIAESPTFQTDMIQGKPFSLPPGGMRRNGMMNGPEQ